MKNGKAISFSLISSSQKLLLCITLLIKDKAAIILDNQFPRFFNIRYLALFYFLLLSLYGGTQKKAGVEWVFLVNGFSNAQYYDLAVDNTGNSYLAAFYCDKVNIPELNKTLPCPPTKAGSLFMKIDNAGKVIWVHPLLSDKQCIITTIATAPDGDVIITGHGEGVISFPSPGDTLRLGYSKAKNSYRQPEFIFIARYSPDGIRRWAHTLNNSSGQGQGIAVNSKNEIYWSFYHSGTLRDGSKVIDSIPSKQENDENRVTIAKLDENGKVIQFLPFKCSLDQTAYPSPLLAIDRNDNLIVYGRFKGKVRFSKKDSLTNDSYYESEDSYVAKYDSGCNFLWARKIGGQNAQVIKDLTIDSLGRIYAVGYYCFECVVSKGIKIVQKSKYEYKSGNSFFYCMFMPDGKLGYAKFYQQKGYSSYCEASSVALDDDGYVHIAGWFTDTLNFGAKIIPVITNSWGKGNEVEFTSTWHGDSIISLEKTIQDKGAFDLLQKIRINHNLMIMGGLYSRENKVITAEGKLINFTQSKYGNSSYVIGVNLKKNPKRIEPKIDYLATVQPMLKCLTPDKEPEPSLWFPLIDSAKQRHTDTISDYCGVKLDSCEASLYPNPTRQATTLKLKGLKGICRIDIISSAGELLYSQQVDIANNEQNIEIDLSTLVAGLYFVSIIQHDFRKALRVVKIN